MKACGRIPHLLWQCFAAQVSYTYLFDYKKRELLAHGVNILLASLCQRRLQSIVKFPTLQFKHWKNYFGESLFLYSFPYFPFFCFFFFSLVNSSYFVFLNWFTFHQSAVPPSRESGNIGWKQERPSWFSFTSAAGTAVFTNAKSLA